MKKLVLLLTIISHFAFGQNNAPQYNSTTKKTTQYTGVVPKAPVWSATDTTSGKSSVYQFETNRIKYKNQRIETDTSKFDKVNVGKGDSAFWVSKKLISGSGAIDTLKVGRIEQGRGTAPIFMYFNGVAWVRNDTSYVAQTGTNKFSGDFLSNQSFFTFGLNSTGNHIIYSDQNYGRMISENSSSGIQSSVGAFSSSDGSIQLGVTNPTPAYSRQFVINGSSSATPNLAYMFDKGIAYYNGDYSAEMEASQNTIPSLKKVKQLISDSIAGGGSGITSVYSANSDILVDSSITGKRKLTLNKTLTSGYINIGDGTNTSFPRAISGDATISNLGALLFSNVNSNVGTFGGATQSTTQTVNAKGLITSISNVTITPAVGSITGLGTGVASWLATPSSANLRTAITDETGTGVAVFGTSPTFTTNIATPLIVGGTSTTSALTYKTTTGVGTTGADHIFQVGNNGATEAMRILNNGNVGIGTTTPVAQLHLSSDVTNSTRGLVIDQHSTDAASAPMFFRKSRGTLLSPTTVADQDYIGIPLFASYDGTSYLQAAGFGARVNGTVATGSVPTDLFFYTGSGNLTNPYVSGNVRMVINSTGNVGIGITSPTAQLHVSTNGQSLNSIFASASVVDAILYSGTKRLVHRMVVSNDTLGVRPLINFQRTRGSNTSPTSVTNGTSLGSILASAYDGTSIINGTDITSIVNGTVSTGVVPSDMVFSTTATNTLIERMRINSTGNVGIGITSPTTGRLQISAGSASIAGLQLTNQTAYTGAIKGSISLENTNEVTVVGNILAKIGTTANIGTSDNQALQLVTNNTSRLSIGTSGIVTLTAALVGIVSQDVFNTTSTTINAFGAATTATIFGASTESVTYGIGNNATASGNTKAINIGTSGASGSTTNVVIGSSTSGANSTLTVNGTIKSTGYTVATLPTGSVGMRAYVTDALAPSYSATVVGGGAVIVSVFHNGTNWICN